MKAARNRNCPCMNYIILNNIMLNVSEKIPGKELHPNDIEHWWHGTCADFHGSYGVNIMTIDPSHIARCAPARYDPWGFGNPQTSNIDRDQQLLRHALRTFLASAVGVYPILEKSRVFGFRGGRTHWHVSNWKQQVAARRQHSFRGIYAFLYRLLWRAAGARKITCLKEHVSKNRKGNNDWWRSWIFIWLFPGQGWRSNLWWSWFSDTDSIGK